MNIVIINGSARKGNTLTTIDAFIKLGHQKRPRRKEATYS